MQEIIKISNLKKIYEGGVIGIDDISFSIYKNEMFGFVGPDGAGKTTTIRLLCGLINPTDGNADIMGYDLRKDKMKIKDNIGYLSQKFSLYTDLSVDENIEFFADIHGVKDYKERRNELLQFTRLTDFRKFYAGKLSGGMKQKLALACTLIHKPKIIFLDEPTTGVDPVSRRDFWKILSDLIKEEITIIISTPYLDEAERFNRLALFNNAKILKLDTPAKIRESLHKTVIEIVCNNIRSADKALKENTNYEIQTFGDRLNIVADSFEKDFPVIENILSKNGIEIQDKRIIPASLENVFIHLLKTKKTELQQL
ncbi:MAG: ABC transporter ATP-binding protein [Bacteroidetes bacterium]|nr:ABC transporter ATP-binding protein [Bacteroidota bacterium]MBX7045719.1 ABC transporter ATP-binding protein [Ignavibacteria bacterium]